jgi:hypothetical protein
MHWSTYVSTLHGAAVPIDNNLEASVAYSAFLGSGAEGAEDVSFAQFLSEYRKTLAEFAEQE